MKGPLWMTPVEIVRASCNPEGTRTMTRLALGGALFDPHAVVELTEAGFVAVVTFEEPKYPGLKQEAAILLIAAPQENAA